MLEWRKKRKNKALYESQIEVCERALKELDAVQGVAEDKRLAARKAIVKEVEKLKATKRPVLLKHAPLVGGEDVYYPELAEQVRKDLAKAGLLPKK